MEQISTADLARPADFDAICQAFAVPECGALRTEFIEKHFHLCYCWGETLRTLTAESALHFCDQIAEICNPVGSKVTILPYMLSVLQCMRRETVVVEFPGMQRKDVTKEHVTAAVSAKLPGIKLTFAPPKNARVIELMIFSERSFGGHVFPGVAYRCEEAYKSFDENDFSVQLATLELTNAGQAVPEDVGTWFKQQFSFPRDYLLRTAMQLRKFNIRPEKDKMIIGRVDSASFKHALGGLTHLLATTKLDEDAVVDLFVSQPEDFAPTAGVVVANENGMQLGSMISICVPIGPSDHITLITDQRYIITSSSGRPSTADLRPGGALWSRLHVLQGGIVSQHIPQDRHKLIEDCSGHAYRIIALTRILKDYVELEHLDVLEHVVLREVKDRDSASQQQNFLDQGKQIQQHERQIVREYDNFQRQIAAELWHPTDLTKRQMIKNARSGRISPWLWCCLVLKGKP